MINKTDNLSLKAITIRTIHQILSKGPQEKFILLVAQKDLFINFFRELSFSLTTIQKRTARHQQYIWTDMGVDALRLCPELSLNNISSERIKYIAIEIPNIWNYLDQQQKRALFLSSIFTNTSYIQDSAEFDLHLTAQQSAHNLLKILNLGANFTEIILSDQKAWFDILLNNHLIYWIPDRSLDRIKEILKALTENNIQIISKNPKIVDQYQKELSKQIDDCADRLQVLPNDMVSSIKIESLQQTKQYLTELQNNNISYDVATEASLNNISPPSHNQGSGYRSVD